ncbi:MAG: hypothetical protein LHW64_08360 [Candidatus Cloacimonetes bacterium]|nr:hypothetical protein [Candidatus Cloacimonadota bacterium]MCB5287805.1 hypothetical protein [Candidatus Cloacimonadota bacterium]MCK9184012.1 hypothetical protein [Candidatus Cloacimonadota bacterium]MCK9584171.1 hypothetical protein [Candidatus Cloacimonadota bacterium]MDY0230126.1 hypothetical protein [Candidatus Cloacimonadaceae bacterium]
MSDETVWLSVNQMAELFDIDETGIMKHLKNTFEKNKLDRNAVGAFLAPTASDRNV